MFDAVIALSQLLDPWTRIINFVLAVVGIPLAIWKGKQAQAAILGWFARIFGGVENASSNANAAANAAGDTAAAVSSTVSAVKETTTSNTQVNQSVLFMADQLGETKQVIDWMARRNDDTLAALFQVVARDGQARQAEQAAFEERVRRLEQFQAEAAEVRRGGRHATGAIDIDPDEQDEP